MRPPQEGDQGDQGSSSGSSEGEGGEDPGDDDGSEGTDFEKQREGEEESEEFIPDEETTPTSVADSPPSGNPEAESSPEEGPPNFEEEGEEESPTEGRGRDIAVNRAGGDETFYSEETGLLWIRHRARRRRYVVPGGPGCPFSQEYFKPNRWTKCQNADTENPLETVETEDNWEFFHDCEGPFRWWTGWTVFQVQGYERPTSFPWEATEPPRPPSGTDKCVLLGVWYAFL